MHTASKFASHTRSQLMSEIACRGIWDAQRPMRLRSDDELRALLDEWEADTRRMNTQMVKLVNKALAR